jgi:hypothetical protein
MGKMAQIRQISYFKNSKSPEPYDNFQRVAKDIEGFCFFPTCIHVMLPNSAKNIFWMIATLATSRNP